MEARTPAQAGPRRSGPSRRYRARLRARLEGRRILVTGASSGIGRAFALHAGASGADVALLARREKELDEVARRIRDAGGRATTHPLDLADTDAVSRSVSLIEARGAIDVLVHDAALSIRRPVCKLGVRDLRRLVDVDYLGAAALTLGLLPGMRQRGGGHIVQVSTIGVLTGAPNFAGYVAAKAAADHFARTLRLELGGEGIRVTQLAMPLVRTPMMEPSRIYRAFPALGVERAAERIGWAVIRRPLRVAPRWAIALELLHVLQPALLQWLFTRGHEPFHAWMRRRLARLERAGAAASSRVEDGVLCRSVRSPRDGEPCVEAPGPWHASCSRARGQDAGTRSLRRIQPTEPGEPR